MRNTTMRTAMKAMLTTGVAAGAILSAQPVLAQDAPAAEEAAASEEIVIIGTRRTDRSVTDSASPIDVIGATELGNSPSVNMLDTIKNLVPSFFVPQNTISDASTFVRAPSLRGLGADQILVMINGKRYNRSALVNVYTGADTALSFGSQGADIGNIPSIAVKNLQVLRDGATAQYGADAIAGVLNYAIRDDAGIEIQGLYGETYRGDGASKIISGNAGFKLGDRGFINFSAEWYDQGQTSRGATRASAISLATSNPAVAGRIPGAADGLPAQIWGTSPGDGFKLFLNAAIDVGSESQIYFTGNYASSETNQSFNYRLPVSQPGLVVDIGTGTPSTRSPGRNGSFAPIFLTPCPAASAATCPTGGFVNDTNTFSFSSIYPGGFTPRFIGKVDQQYGTVGFKGKVDSGFTYDLSATFARNSLDLSMTNSLSASFGPQSQTSFEFGKLIQTEQTLNADFTYPLEVGFESPITLSLGAEYRRESYEKTVGDVQSYAAGPFASQVLYNLVTPAAGATPAVFALAGTTATQSPAASGYGGVSPNFAGTSTQSNYGFYIGAEADVTKALTIGLAGRFENYDTFGSVVVGKANALYRVSDTVSLRATVGTGFHAPSPGQNNTQVVTTNFLGGNQVQTGTYPTTSAIAQYYGAGSLDPERSTNFGAGVVLKPVNNLSLTVDGYIIKVRDRIGISQNFTVIPTDITALPALATVGLGGVVNYFTNGFDVTSKGIEAVANYRTDLMGGPLNLTFAYSYNNLKAKNIKLSTLGTPLVSAQQEYNIANLAPQNRITASAGWQIGDFGINARANYYGKWSNALEYNLVAPTPATAANPFPAAPASQIFGAKTLFDLDLSYTIAEHYTLTVGANNIFNTFPDKIKASTINPIYALSGALNDGQIYPRSGGPFGINGGFYYVRLRVKY
jgi:iron complex outermembrane recepter protein